jgi:hypothetical protein
MRRRDFVKLIGGMRRRDFVTLLGGAAATWPFAASGQQSGTPMIGILGATTAHGYAAEMAAFHQGLKETGFVEGRDVAVEYRWAHDRYERLPALAAELVGHHVAVIATIGGQCRIAGGEGSDDDDPGRVPR